MARSGHSDAFSHSLTDLMTSLAVIFILLLCVTLNNAFSEAGKVKDAKKNLKQEVIKVLKELGLELTEDPDDPLVQVINIDENKIKFELNKSALNPQAIELIDKLFVVLSAPLCDEKLRANIDSVIVEGHTDATGDLTTEGQLHNFKLSEERAFAVLEQAFRSVAQRDPDHLQCLRSLTSATGRGSSKPKKILGAGSGALDDSGAIHRRVEIKIRVKPGDYLRQILSELN